MMQEQTLKEKISLYKAIYTELYNGLKWKADKRSLMLIAAMYVTNAKEFNLKGYLELADYIKGNVGIFSQLRSAQRYTTAATLDTTTDDPKNSFHRFITIYEKLIENGFSRTVYSYISAGTLLKVEPNRIDEKVRKSLELYKGMKEHHFFLTNSSDYPLASILALHEENTEATINNVEDCYQELQKKGFSRGNDLQFLSHILALDTNHRADVKAEKCLKIWDLLKAGKHKPKKIYYPYIGMLSFLENIENDIKSLYEINDELNSDKLFKWNKEMNFMLSVLFLMNSLSSIGDASRTGLNVSVEILIQAQQAAMTASITAATVATSSNNGNS